MRIELNEVLRTAKEEDRQALFQELTHNKMSKEKMKTFTLETEGTELVYTMTNDEEDKNLNAVVLLSYDGGENTATAVFGHMTTMGLANTIKGLITTLAKMSSKEKTARYLARMQSEVLKGEGGEEDKERAMLQKLLKGLAQTSMGATMPKHLRDFMETGSFSKDCSTCTVTGCDKKECASIPDENDVEIDLKA